MGLPIERRKFLGALGSAAFASPLAAWAQQGGRSTPVGVFNATYAQCDREWQARYAAFIEAFQKLGWTEGRNVRLEYRWESADLERVRVAAAELVRSEPDVIVSVSNDAVAELRRVTSTIPIVFAQVSDSVDGGFVASLARPGGNATGFENFEPTIGGKWLGMLKEAAPNLRRVAVLKGPNAANTRFLRAAEAVAPSLGVAISPIDVLAGGEIEQAVARFAETAD